MASPWCATAYFRTYLADLEHWRARQTKVPEHIDQFGKPPFPIGIAVEARPSAIAESVAKWSTPWRSAISAAISRLQKRMSA